MDLELAGRVAMITGPAKGMGAAVTRAFAREGCRLALMGRDVEAIAPGAGAVTAAGAQAIVVECDVTDAAQCEDAVRRTRTAYDGRVDILVNVAGGSGPVGKTGWATTPEGVADIVPLHMAGCFTTNGRG